jgi:hypothetical protein
MLCYIFSIASIQYRGNDQSIFVILNFSNQISYESSATDSKKKSLQNYRTTALY